MKQVITVYLLSAFWLYSHPSFANDSIAALINDTINKELLQASKDTAAMNTLLVKIRKNRQKLEHHYESVLLRYIDQAREMDYPYALMKALDYLGLQERYNEHYDLAVDYHLQSLKIARELNDSVQMSYNYNNLAQAYRKQDLNSVAIPYFYKALSVDESLGRYQAVSYTHNTLGATYLAQKELEKALFHLKESSKIAERTNDIRTLSYNSGMTGEVMLLKNQPDEALACFNRALKYKEELNYTNGMAVTYHLMGQAYYLKGDYTNAIEFFNEAILIHKKADNQRYLALCYAYLGKIKWAQKQPAIAIEYLTMGKDLAIKARSIEYQILINDAFTELYTAQNSWQQAYTTACESHLLSDSLNVARNQKQLQALDIEYQTNKKEQQIALLQTENQLTNQRLRLDIAVIVILALTLAFTYYILQVRKKSARIKEERLQQQLLKSQMNPHFIFNALGSIQNFMYRNEADKAARYLGNFAALTRSILNNSSAESITLEEEINTIKNYLELEQMRVNGAFSYRISYNDDLETELINIPPMLLQPFIENAIKHGFQQTKEQGIIELRLSDKGQYLCAEIEDNGIGINNTLLMPKSNHKSMATAIFKHRIGILRNSHPHLPEWEITDLSTSNQTGTLARVYIPILN